MKSKNSSLKKLQKKLREWGCEAGIIENPIDLFYLTGLKLSAGSILFDPKQAILIVDGRYLHAAQEESSLPVFLMQQNKIKEFFKKKEQIAFDSCITSYERYQHLKEDIPLLQPIPGMLKEMRAIKSSSELKKLRQSAKLLWKGFVHIQNKIAVGMTEKQLAWEFESYCREKGAERMAFEPIVAFGANSAMPHHRAGNTRLKKGDIILLDLGVCVDHYHSDMTRTLFFGKSSPLLQKMEDLVVKAQRAALNMCRPGTLVAELDRAARKVFEKGKMDHYFVHSLGHGVGLEVHEYPRISESGADKGVFLEPGMVITIEPGLYVPGKGGVRREDTVIITPKGFETINEPAL